MEKKKNGNLKFLIALFVVIVIMTVAAFVTDGEDVTETAWSLVPRLIAIQLELVRKEV